MNLESSGIDCKKRAHLYIALKKAYESIDDLEKCLQLREETLRQTREMLALVLTENEELKKKNPRKIN